MNFSKKIGSKIVMTAVFLCLLAYLTPVAYANDGSLWDTIKGYGADLLDTAQEKGSELVDTVKEKGPGVIESAKDKGSELVGKAKNGLEKAGNAAAEFNQNQQEEFWERFDQQTGLDTSSAYRDSIADSPVPDDGSGAKDPHSDPDQTLNPPQDASSQQPNASANDQQSQPAGDTIIHQNNTYNDNRTYYYGNTQPESSTEDTTQPDNDTLKFSTEQIAIFMVSFIAILAVGVTAIVKIVQAFL